METCIFRMSIYMQMQVSQQKTGQMTLFQNTFSMNLDIILIINHITVVVFTVCTYRNRYVVFF